MGPRPSKGTVDGQKNGSAGFVFGRHRNRSVGRSVRRSPVRMLGTPLTLPLFNVAAGEGRVPGSPPATLKRRGQKGDGQPGGGRSIDPGCGRAIEHSTDRPSGPGDQSIDLRRGKRSRTL